MSDPDPTKNPRRMKGTGVSSGTAASPPSSQARTLSPGSKKENNNVKAINPIGAGFNKEEEKDNIEPLQASDDITMKDKLEAEPSGMRMTQGTCEMSIAGSGNSDCEIVETGNITITSETCGTSRTRRGKRRRTDLT